MKFVTTAMWGIGGDVDPNHMDAVMVLSTANWIMAELVRLFHGLKIAKAQQVVDTLVEVRIAVIWSDGNVKRVLRPELKLHEQIVLLVAVSVPDVTSKELLEWIEEDDKAYFMKTLRKLHSQRLVEFTENTDKVKILPPGAKFVQDLIRKKEPHWRHQLGGIWNIRGSTGFNVPPTPPSRPTDHWRLQR